MAVSAKIDFGCTTGVMACDGCATNNAAAAVTASAVALKRVFISNSLHKPAGHVARIDAWKAVRPDQTALRQSIL
jgi:hypothetical protein